MKLRIALRDDDGTLIKTIHGVGYRWTAPLQMDVIHARQPLNLAAMQLKEDDVLPMRPNWQLQRQEARRSDYPRTGLGPRRFRLDRCQQRSQPTRIAIDHSVMDDHQKQGGDRFADRGTDKV